MATTLEPISLTESKQLQQLEIIIEQNRIAFVQVAEALQHIRDNRLYRAEFKTFQAYCRDKWNFTRQYVNQIIAGAEAVRTLPQDLETMVSNQRSARELARVPTEHRAEVVQKAAEGGKVTAASIKAAAAPVMPTPQPDPIVKQAPALVAAFEAQEERQALPECEQPDFFAAIVDDNATAAIEDGSDLQITRLIMATEVSLQRLRKEKARRRLVTAQ